MGEVSVLHEVFERFAKRSESLEQACLALQERFKVSQTLDAIVSHLSEGLLFVSEEGVVTLFNKAAENITGVLQENALESRYEALFSDTLFGFSMREALMSGQLGKKMLLTFSRGESSKEIEGNASFLPGHGVLLVLSDVSERRSLERTVHHNEQLKALGEMAAGLAHEIRNPLGGMEGLLSLLIMDLQENKNAHAMLLRIQEGTRLLGRLLSNVLSYARPVELHLTSCNMREIIEKSLLLFPDQREVVVKEKVPLVVVIDKDLMMLALFNLFKNAFEASMTGTPVRVVLAQEGELAVISITNSGAVISQDALSKLFTPFFTTKKEGCGLGLAEVHKIIHAHGGTIAVESRENTTFTIHLP